MSAATTGCRVTRDTRHLIGHWHERIHDAVLLSLPSVEPREYLYDLLPHYPQRSSKGLRPVLCIAACEAFGGSERQALPFAVAIELLHNAFLVIDDIQDGSEFRRGHPALHTEQGTPLALNAGNALAARANSALLRAVRSQRPAVATALIEGWELMITETIEGQALDLGWQRDNVVDLSIADYLRMCGKKTAWYTTIQPLAMGAMVGSGRPHCAGVTFQFGWILGLLFQIANDIDGLEDTSGKSELAEGQRSILVVHLLGTLVGDARKELVRILSLPRHLRGHDEVAWIRDQMDEADTVGEIRASLLDLASAAQAEAEKAFGPLPETPGREVLLSITGYVLEVSGFKAPLAVTS